MIHVFWQNATVHRAAANDVDFRNRAARGSGWNGLLFAGLRLGDLVSIVSIPEDVKEVIIHSK